MQRTVRSHSRSPPGSRLVQCSKSKTPLQVLCAPAAAGTPSRSVDARDVALQIGRRTQMLQVGSDKIRLCGLENGPQREECDRGHRRRISIMNSFASGASVRDSQWTACFFKSALLSTRAIATSSAAAS